MAPIFSIPLGWPLPKRRKYLSDLQSEPPPLIRKLVFQDQLQTFHVYRVPIDLPKYRLANGRTQAEQEEYLATHPELPQDFFTKDLESEEAHTVQQIILEGLLKGTDPDTDLMRYFTTHQQDEPLILSAEGYVVNGNRRLCAMRKLYYGDKSKFAHFSHADVIILPPCEPKDLDELEARLQIEPDIKQQYTWIAKACMLRKRQQQYGYDNRQLGNLYRMKEEDVREDLDLLSLVDDYLSDRGKERQYHNVNNSEFAFRQLRKARKKCKGEDKKDLLTQVSYTFIDGPAIEGRLYQRIPEVAENLAKVAHALAEQAKVEPKNKQTNDQYELFGNGDNELEPVAEFVKKPENRPTVIDVVQDVLDGEKLKKRQKQEANSVLQEVSRANAALSAAVNCMSRNSEKTGVSAQLDAIESLRSEAKSLVDEKMIRLTFHPEEQAVQLQMVDRLDLWPAVRRAIVENSQEASVTSATSLDLPVWSFLRTRKGLRYVLQKYNIQFDADKHVTEMLKDAAKRERLFYAVDLPPAERSLVSATLVDGGFKRALTEYQERNVLKLTRLPAAATFSVPGAGKTTEALAFFLFLRTKDSRLLVVCPKNAFAVWEEQISLCLRQPDPVIRLVGGESAIRGLLAQEPKVMLITYQQLPNVVDAIGEYLWKYPSFMFLDESHRIKKGPEGAWASAVLRLSHLPAFKLVMSGTPMPNDEADLLPQFNFLYPEIGADQESVMNLIKPVFVRTTKQELGLPNINRSLVPIRMRPAQRHLYELMRSEEARQLANLKTRDRARLRAYGRSVIRLLQMASNPALLARADGNSPPELFDVLAEGDSPKIQYACLRARMLAKLGQKSVIWSTFVENVELISKRLSDIGADYIHGGVDAGSEEEANTRENKIARFHKDPSAFVLVANPAACSESISLHTVCHCAIYVDRNYNAAQYLQSEDRIHRLGLPKDTATNVEILFCPDSVDESVRRRLEKKVERMAEVLEDASLNIEPVETDLDSDGLDSEDIEDYLKHLVQGEP